MSLTPEKQYRGWLANPARKERRDNAYTLTDDYVMQQIQKIESMDKYAKTEADSYLRCRDECLLALGITFFKRGNELLNLHFGDIAINEKDGMLYVTFNIEKKMHRKKICPSCSHKNGMKAVFCSKCGISIKEIPVVSQGSKEKRMIKPKALNNPFCKYIVNWYNILKAQHSKTSDYIFGPFRHVSAEYGYFPIDRTRHITIQALDQMLQRLDPTLTSSMFRYGKAEDLLRRGKTPEEVRQYGDWEGVDMPLIYAKRKGITQADKDFAEDMGTYAAKE